MEWCCGHLTSSHISYRNFSIYVHLSILKGDLIAFKINFQQNLNYTWPLYLGRTLNMSAFLISDHYISYNGLFLGPFPIKPTGTKK